MITWQTSPQCMTSAFFTSTTDVSILSIPDSAICFAEIIPALSGTGRIIQGGQRIVNVKAALIESLQDDSIQCECYDPSRLMLRTRSPTEIGFMWGRPEISDTRTSNLVNISSSYGSTGRLGSSASSALAVVSVLGL